MNWRRIAQRKLMALAHASREAGERGYFLFWRIQKRIQTQAMRDEDSAALAASMAGFDWDSFYAWQEEDSAAEDEYVRRVLAHNAAAIDAEMMGGGEAK